MLTAIAVTSADLVLPPPDAHTPTAHVLTPPDRQPLDAAVHETRLLVEQHGCLVVLYPSSAPAAFVRRLHTVRSVLESDRIALLGVDLPPLGTAVLARQICQLSVCDFSPGVLGAAVRLLAHYVYAGALLNSVARLDRVPVPLTAHARSWMPGSQFAVLAGPAPQLVRVGGEEVPAGPEFGTQLTFAAGSLAPGWVTGTLAPRWRVRDVREAPLPAESTRWWGTGRLVEFAAAIWDVSVLYRLVGSVRREECHWCGLELIGDRCAFCSAPVPTEERGALPAGTARTIPAIGGAR
ncbi:zinc ribbon domain-containing protein [Streptomyces sp. CNQ085]|uniref:zinc ribbon domain-containing protein n=1 Tax=Streptomyces sp. CNQ085 TaxID=2886944 RepID=UPI001F507ADF|nr:zinc ribbon domain-containing protein [Streptomyces sp. CNQ085]MCI0383871.1 hypothetical protein [Streptomyces sp. CNQ085]